ncbi:MAG TPA: tRNA-binding protein [Bacteroidetes bacterium]|nr:tRNA-binding protein [Bacteroidota bacterium]
MKQISYQDFLDVEIRTGKIIRAEDFPKAKKPAYKLWIDFGEFGIKKSSAQITKLYEKEDLIGKTILGVVNFPPKQVADFMSEALVLGVIPSDDEVVLVVPEKNVRPGLKLL